MRVCVCEGLLRELFGNAESYSKCKAPGVTMGNSISSTTLLIQVGTAATFFVMLKKISVVDVRVDLEMFVYSDSHLCR